MKDYIPSASCLGQLSTPHLHESNKFSFKELIYCDFEKICRVWHFYLQACHDKQGHSNISHWTPRTPLGRRCSKYCAGCTAIFTRCSEYCAGCTAMFTRVFLVHFALLQGSWCNLHCSVHFKLLLWCTSWCIGAHQVAVLVQSCHSPIPA